MGESLGLKCRQFERESVVYQGNFICLSRYAVIYMMVGWVCLKLRPLEGEGVVNH